MKRLTARLLSREPPIGLAAVLAALLVLLVPVAGLPADDTVVEVLRVDYRTADDMLPLVEPLLSPQGSVSADSRTNSLVIVDTPDTVERVRRFLSTSDRPGKQVTVKVRFGESRLASGSGASVSGRVSGKNWKAQVGRPRLAGDGVRVRARAGSRRHEGQSEYFIRVMSGSSAYIWAGKEIPYTQRWADLCRRYGGIVETVTYKRVESGFDVRPTVTGSHQANVVITPRIALQGSGRRQQVIRFAEASTTLTVPLGRWVSIGGTGSSKHEVTREILASGTRRSNSALNIELRVE